MVLGERTLKRYGGFFALTIMTVCKHRWTDINTTYLDRKHWITSRRCRKCSDEVQAEYRVVDVNGQIRTTCTITAVVITKYNQNDATNQQTLPDHDNGTLS